MTATPDATLINWDAVYEDIGHWEQDLEREPVLLVLSAMMAFLEDHQQPLPPGWQRVAGGYAFTRPEQSV